jgi:hypothetical protein
VYGVMMPYFLASFAVQPYLVEEIAHAALGPYARHERVIAGLRIDVELECLGIAANLACKGDIPFKRAEILAGDGHLRAEEDVGKLLRIDHVGAEPVELDFAVGEYRCLDAAIELAQAYLEVFARSDGCREAAVLLGEAVDEDEVDIVADAI